MKRDTWITTAVASALAFLICFGAVGCVVSGFDLPVDHFTEVMLICAAASVFCAAAFRLKWGGAVVVCALVVSAGVLWHRGEAAVQLLGLVQRISAVYDRAYGWGLFQSSASPEQWTADIPMACLGVILSVVITWSVCRKLGPGLPVLVSLLPLCACMVVTDTVPKEEYLFCLILGLIILLITGRVRILSPSQANRLTAMTVLPAALALLAVFLAFPQKDYVNRSEATRDAILSWFQSIPQRVEGAAQEITVSSSAPGPEQVRLSSLGRRIESPATVMEVTAEVGGTLYLRGQDYDIYDAMSWTSSGSRTEDFSLTGEDYGDVAIRTVNPEALLYLPYYPARGMALIGGKMDNTWRYTEYVVPRSGLPDDWRITAVSTAGNPPSPDSIYLALPDETRSRAQVLLTDILPDASSVVEKAEAIRDYVRACARYDLNPSRMPGEASDFALWFLEQGEAGYCVHFATATVVLLRAAGIEARYVSGYLVKTVPGTAAAVTGKNAHAWAEYYEPALGVWLVLESTPADAAAEQTPAAGTQTESVSTVPPEPTAAVPSTTPSAQPGPSSEPAPAQPDAPRQHDAGILPVILLAPVLLAGLIVLQRSLRIRLRRLKLRSAPPNLQGLALWREAERLSGLLRQSPPKELEALAQKAKFSQHTLTAEELQQFEDYQAAARHQLEQRPWYLKLIYRYIYAVI